MARRHLPLFAFAILAVALPATAQGGPSCHLDVSPDRGNAPLTVTANATCEESNNIIVQMILNWGDGSPQVLVLSASVTAQHTYTNIGRFTVTVVGTDATNNQGSDSREVRVESAPNARPTCNLSVSPNNGPAPLTVTANGNCTDPENDITSTVIAWGDGATTAAASGTHTYPNPGTFTVTVTATDSANNRGTDSATVRVTSPQNAPPTCTLNVTPLTGPAPLSVTASGNCTDPENDIRSTVITWGDGTSTASTSGTHVYNAPGAFTVTLTATDNAGGTASATAVVTVAGVPGGQRPTCTLNVTPTSGAVPLAVTATASCADPNQDINRIVIDFGDGFYHRGATFSHTYIASGSFQVTVVATDQAGNSSDPASRTVNVDPNPALFVGISDGKVSQFTKSGTLVKTLDSSLGGSMTGMGFDSTGTLYATNFTANAVSRFSGSGTRLGTFGGGYNCKPESIAFDAAGNAYVGETGCSHALLKFDAYGNLSASYTVTTQAQGSDWVDVASDQCTIFYTSEGSSILRFNGCTGQQLSPFSTSLTRGLALRILPDGGVLVANKDDIVRLDSAGRTIMHYTASGESCWAALTLDDDGSSFWAADFCSSDVLRFDINSGNQLFKFNSGTPTNTVFGIATRPAANRKTPAGPLITAPVQASVSAGQSAPFTLTFFGTPAAAGRNFSLSCSNLPAGATCSFSPPSITGGANVTFNLNINTAAGSTGWLPTRARRVLLYASWLPFAFILLPLGSGRGRHKRQILGMLALFVLASALLACSGATSGSSNNQPSPSTPVAPTAVSATPAGTYNVVIHATSGSLGSSTSVQLAVE